MKSYPVIVLFALLLSCTNQFEKVERSFDDGGAELVGIYKVNGDTTRIGEKHFYPNGGLRMTAFYDESGKRTGKWDYFYEDGKLWSTCEYEQGLKHGKSEVFFLNGQLRYEGEYYFDEAVKGSFRYYSEDGSLTKEE